VSGGNPYAIYQTHEESVQEKFVLAIPGDDISTNNKNDEPKNRFPVGGDPVHGRKGHEKAEERELKDQFPVHNMGFW
jgi:hypothetical protein